MPLEQISQLFEDRYGYDLNSATIEGTLERGYHLAEAIESQSMASLRSALPHHLSAGELEEPLPQPGKRGKPKQSPGRNLLNRLRKPEDGVLAFALESGVPFTNNQAERDLRPAKVKLKVSGCFRTKRGACVYARLQATVSTFRKPGLKVFATLRDWFAHRPVVLP
jgi:transposase